MGKLLMINTNSALDFPAVWYHGTSDVEVPNIRGGIDLSKGRKLVDFGPGFYLTSNREQAVAQAIRKVNKHNKAEQRKFLKERRNGRVYKRKFARQGAVLTYTLSNDQLAACPNQQFFNAMNEDWGSFVLGNRCNNPEILDIQFHNRDHFYDFVYGPLADGFQIPTLIGYVENDEMSAEQFFEEIRDVYDFPELNQLSIHTPQAIGCFLLKDEVDYIETSSNVGSQR